MAVFNYTAVDGEGRRVTGSVAVETRAAAIEQITAKSLYPTAVEEAVAAGASRSPARRLKVSPASLDTFTRGLANLLAAGVPLNRGLRLLSGEVSQPAARRCWEAIYQDVVGGMSLADAMSRWPRTFPPVYVAMVRAGEAGGFLDKVLAQIADFRQRERDLKGRVTAALVYPAVLAGLAVVVLTFLLTFFIPRFHSVFEEFGGSLPWLTRAIVGTSQFFVAHWLVLLVLAAAVVVAVRRALATEPGRRLFERIVLRTPTAGSVVSRLALVRFCSMLGTLLGAGVPLLAALRTAAGAIGNQTLADTVALAVDEVQRGAPLAQSLGRCPQLFSPSVLEMVSVGEETGRLDKELVRLGDTFEKELDRRLRMLVALVEPILLFTMAGLIGTIVIGMLLPVFTLQELIR